MAIFVRHRVFETNSSSSHSLTVGQRDLAAMPFPEEMLREGIVRISPGSFNWEWKRYYTALGKASYLLTQAARDEILAIIEDGNENQDDITIRLCSQNRYVATLRKVIEEETGCALVIELGKDRWIGIDHESVGNGMQVLYNDVDLAGFLFDTTSYIETGNDNDDHPAMIEVDDGGSEHYDNVRGAKPVRSMGPGR